MILSQKCRKGRDSLFFPALMYLHTQEVTGSSPVVSTKKFLISQEIRNFSFYLYEICILVIVLVRPDQYDDQYGDNMRLYRISYILQKIKGGRKSSDQLVRRLSAAFLYLYIIVLDTNTHLIILALQIS